LARRQRGRKSRSRALNRRIAAIKFVLDKELRPLYQRADNSLIEKRILIETHMPLPAMHHCLKTIHRMNVIPKKGSNVELQGGGHS
jgi:hypothetical protein